MSESHRDPHMLNIRFVPKTGPNHLSYIGLPKWESQTLENGKGEPYQHDYLAVPAPVVFQNWWSKVKEAFSKTGKLINPETDEEVKEIYLLRGGYYNVNPNTNQIIGTIVQHAQVIDSYPRKGTETYEPLEWEAAPAIEATAINSELPIIEGLKESDDDKETGSTSLADDEQQ